MENSIIQCLPMKNSIPFEIVKIILMGLGVVAVIVKIVLDYYRNKKQSTIEFYNLISTESYKLYDEMGEDNIDLTIIYKDADLEKSISRYLGRLERLAVGINSGIYDFKTLDKMCGQYLIERYKQFENYINEKRESGVYPYCYKEFQKLVERIVKDRQKHSKEKDT